MAEKFGCSIPLIYKRLQEAGLKLRDRYSNISDADLDSKVSGLQSKFPNAGSVASYYTFFHSSMVCMGFCKVTPPLPLKKIDMKIC